MSCYAGRRRRRTRLGGAALALVAAVLSRSAAGQERVEADSTTLVDSTAGASAPATSIPPDSADPLGSALAAEPPLEGPRVTLDDAVRMALRVSPTVARDHGSITAAGAAERSAVGSFLPSLSFSSDATLASTRRFNSITNTTESGANTTYSAGLAASMDLFTGGRQTAQVKSARAERLAAEASLVSDRFAVALEAKQTFFETLRQIELEAVASERVRRAQEGLGAAAARLAVGSATLSDSLRAQFELTDARVTLLQAQSDLRTAAYAFGRVIGVDGPASPEPPPSLEPRPLPLDDAELVALAVEAAPSVRQAEAQLRSGQAGVQAARSQYFPALRLGAGYDWFNQNFALTDATASWRGVLELSYPLFDRFERNEAVARARADEQGATAALPDARRTARAETERLLAALRLAERRIALAGENVRVASEDLRVQEVRYAQGSSTSLDRITSQVNLAQAEADLVAARYDYQISRAQLEALVGREL